MTRPLRVLTFSSLFPSSVRPNHGIFVETRLRKLLSSGQIESRVVAPVPWFFSTNQQRFGDRARMATTPVRETRNGIDVQHPRYLLIPKIGMSMAPFGMALGARGAVQRLLEEGFDFDVLDAHYYYPDGVAAALLSKWFRKPLTITARGTDLNLIPEYRFPRGMMMWAASKAQASIGVSSSLVDILRGWGVEEQRLHVMRNGVDLDRFRPLPKAEMRERLKVNGSPLLLSVGNLIENKGHDIAIDALVKLLPQHREARLIVIGEGKERANLLALAERLGVETRVTLAGALPHTDLLQWYSAADVLILASSREGWANVLLEAMACGTPVVATRIPGTAEVVASAEAGRLVSERTGKAFADAISQLIAAGVKRDSVRAYAEGFSWQDTTNAQLALFSQLSARKG